jgi:MFS transporter, Spinster family, sphingosine-1-phosphate transporter
MSAIGSASLPSATQAVLAPRLHAGTSRHWALSLILVVGTVCSMDAMILAALLTPMKADLHLSDSAFGSVAAAVTVAGMIGSPIFAALAARVGRRPVLVGTILLWSVSSAGSALTVGIGTLILWRALTGFGVSAYQGLAPGWLADLYDRASRNFIFSLFMVRNKIGSALAFAAGGWIAARHDWHQAFLLTGLPGVVLALLMLTIREPVPGHADGASSVRRNVSVREQLSVLRIGSYSTHLAALTFFFGGMFTAQMWLPPFLHRVHGMDNLHATSFLSVVLLLTTPCGPVGGWLVGRTLSGRRWGLPAVLAVTSIAAAVLFAAAFRTPDLATCKALTIAAIVVFGSTAGSLTTLLVETVPAHLRSISGSFGALVSAGVSGIGAPWLLGTLSDHYGLGSAILIGPVFYTVAGFLWAGLALALGRPGARAISSPDSPNTEHSQ